MLLAVALSAIALLSVGSVRADDTVVAVDRLVARIALLPRASLLVPEGTLTPQAADALLSQSGAMIETSVRSFGYTADVLWSRTTLDVAPAAAGRWYLTLEVPNFDWLEVYRVDPTRSVPPERLFTLGDRTPPVSDIASRFHIAPMELTAGTTTLLFRGRTTGSMTPDLSLRQITPLLREEQAFFGLQTFYLGIVAILLLSTVVTFGFSGERIYLLYCGTLAAQAIYWVTVLGTGPGHLWPALAGRVYIDPLVFIIAALAGLILFAHAFLSAARVPAILLRLMKICAFIALALAAASLLSPLRYTAYVNSAIALFVFPAMIAMMVPTAVAFFLGARSSRPLALACVALICAISVGVMRDNGLIVSNIWVLAAPQLGSLIEMLVFGYMLMARWASAQREKEEMQRQALVAAREQERVLERRVADRTAELNAANTLLRTVVGAAPFPLTLSDVDSGTVLFANDKATEFLGLSPGALAGRPMPDVFAHPDARASAISEMDRLGVLREREVEFRSAGGDLRWVLLWMVPLVLDGRNIRLTAFNDVTRMKSLEQDLRDTAELEMQTAQRERAARHLQQQFVAMVSHEFRTPLAVIDGAVQNLELSDARDTPRLDRIRAAVIRLLRMIDICLTDARIQDGELSVETEDLDLAVLVGDVIDGLDPKDGRLRLAVAGEPLFTAVDEGLVQIAITNVIDNALKYGPEQEPVAVEVTATEEGGIAVSVSDLGPGVPEKERDRVFDKYYRASNIAGLPGAGLGLHLVRMIMEGHGGSVTYDPILPRGSRFTLWFPDVGPDQE
ncbi:ATP-binding protein [Thalassobaculum sp. OXR-137]|uniref:sensor histidine kinase n=1 Tax=Thalassobaculum sp. OXR-137 TaxID=3100173 RepID=UPI002AC89A9B|nr:ATP-binding protein [Thalassobaculum sp. OXR-137]WPZ32737.1 ATP-binding protein [Thalassobaculum sp. OXR-137]